MPKKQSNKPAAAEQVKVASKSDDPFSDDDSPSEIILPKRVEHEEDASIEDETESTLSEKELDNKANINTSEGDKENNLTWDSLRERIASLEEENAELKAFKEKQLLNDSSVKEEATSDLFDKLKKRITDERVGMVLDMVQSEYLKIKYKTHTQEEKDKLQNSLNKFLSQQMEGKIEAAKLIHNSNKS